MSEAPNASVPSTPESVKATAQSSEAPAAGATRRRPSRTYPGEGTAYLVGKGVERAVVGRPYERELGRPLYRPLKIFALDPSVSRLEGATAVVNVPYEPLERGPKGKIFQVTSAAIKTDDQPEEARAPDEPVNLEYPDILIRNGLDPATADPRFREQMVYAVCSTVYTAFRTALGRHIAWGFERPADGRVQLLVKPCAFVNENSYYDKATGELCFGYFRSQEPGGFPGNVYACLSHDVVAHETTHALLDGLRAHFSLPTRADVPAFHEGFADLVAIFQRFSYEQVVRAAIRKSSGRLEAAKLLTDIARQLGQAGGKGKTALRSAVTAEGDKPEPYSADKKPHDLGSVLVAAVFEAFITVFRRKTERLFRLATNGTGQLPPGEMPADLQAALAEKASKLASQFLTICIRAIDYCPPVDITLGEYLRAVITADRDLVPDDPWAYREAWVDAFSRRRIYPRWIEDLSEEALNWTDPRHDYPRIDNRPIKGLTFGRLKFEGDPAWPAGSRELKRQACALAGIVTQSKESMKAFGLALNGDPELEDDEVSLPEVQSIRSSRRIGPSGQVVFDLVAEVTQRRLVRAEFGGIKRECSFYGGSTIIIDPRGSIRYVIRKSVTSKQRLQEQTNFLSEGRNARYREHLCGGGVPSRSLFQMFHDEPPEGEENPK